MRRRMGMSGKRMRRRRTSTGSSGSWRAELEDVSTASTTGLASQLPIAP